MGRTSAVAQITDKAAYRVGLPQTLQVDYIPFYDHNDHQGSINRTVENTRVSKDTLVNMLQFVWSLFKVKQATSQDILISSRQLSLNARRIMYL